MILLCIKSLSPVTIHDTVCSQVFALSRRPTSFALFAGHNVFNFTTKSGEKDHTVLCVVGFALLTQSVGIAGEREAPSLTLVATKECLKVLSAKTADASQVLLASTLNSPVYKLVNAAR